MAVVTSIGQGFSRGSSEGLLVDALGKSQYPSRIMYLNGDLREHFPSIDSTQVYARGLAEVVQIDNWLAITAEEQTAGRGTYNRQWLSPPQVNLYVTFVLPFPNDESHKAFFVSQVTAIAVARTVKEYGIDAEIKWPNDLMIKRKKVSGILSQGIIKPGEKNLTLLIGIGLNVNMEQELCESLDQPVTSLRTEAQRVFDKEEILGQLHGNLKQCMEDLKTRGFSYFLDELNSLIAFRNEKIDIDFDDGTSFRGTFIGIDEMGRMKLEVEDGTIKVIDHGRIRS